VAVGLCRAGAPPALMCDFVHNRTPVTLRWNQAVYTGSVASDLE
jgi:hypothetical protein